MFGVEFHVVSSKINPKISLHSLQEDYRVWTGSGW